MKTQAAGNGPTLTSTTRARVAFALVCVLFAVGLGRELLTAGMRDLFPLALVLGILLLFVGLMLRVLTVKINAIGVRVGFPRPRLIPWSSVVEVTVGRHGSVLIVSRSGDRVALPPDAFGGKALHEFLAGVMPHRLGGRAADVDSEQSESSS